MQMKNVTKKRKVHSSTFCTKIKSALKSIYKDKHVSIFTKFRY